ncbi:MAG TPA: DUF1992 domain-containing protein [Candidatus Dormibacteraeota bacterium]|jgi:hypothetical protein|nr:DUF1992 domain-containing protein [Candidatus Dormibacteraeota bacterium]
MGSFDRLVEGRIREASERGEFRDLAGEGKPLDLEAPGPYEDPTMWAAFHILKNAGMAPVWIEERKELLKRATEARSLFERSGDEDRFRARMEDLNGLVDRHNQRYPLSAGLLERFPVESVISARRTG